MLLINTLQLDFGAARWELHITRYDTEWGDTSNYRLSQDRIDVEEIGFDWKGVDRVPFAISMVVIVWLKYLFGRWTWLQIIQIVQQSHPHGSQVEETMAAMVERIIFLNVDWMIEIAYNFDTNTNCNVTNPDWVKVGRRRLCTKEVSKLYNFQSEQRRRLKWKIASRQWKVWWEVERWWWLYYSLGMRH